MFDNTGDHSGPRRQRYAGHPDNGRGAIMACPPATRASAMATSPRVDARSARSPRAAARAPSSAEAEVACGARSAKPPCLDACRRALPQAVASHDLRDLHNGTLMAACCDIVTVQGILLSLTEGPPSR